MCAACCTDPARLTALVVLGIRNRESFPLIFYRENCADMALCEQDLDAAYLASGACGSDQRHASLHSRRVRSEREAPRGESRRMADVWSSTSTTGRSFGD